MHPGTTYKQAGFEYSVRVVRVLKGVCLMEYIGVDKPSFTTTKEQIEKGVRLGRWIEVTNTKENGTL